MAFRFFRRKKLFPGVSLNLSKSGASLSFGPRGAKMTVGPRGVRKTVGIPGTGMYWTDHSVSGKQRRSRNAAPPAPTVRPEHRLSLGFFKRLMTPQNEEDFVDGMREFVQGHEAAALRRFQLAADLADAAFMRHQTTAYDSMTVPQIKGKRREVQRMLARRSHELLANYRRGESVPEDCPLRRALLALNGDNERNDF